RLNTPGSSRDAACRVSLHTPLMTRRLDGRPALHRQKRISMSSEDSSKDRSKDQRARWDIKYEQGLPSLTEPDPFFISAYERFVSPSLAKPGVALDLAGGLGRHALWLASRNWRVTV